MADQRDGALSDELATLRTRLDRVESRRRLTRRRAGSVAAVLALLAAGTAHLVGGAGPAAAEITVFSAPVSGSSFVVPSPSVRFIAVDVIGAAGGAAGGTSGGQGARARASLAVTPGETLLVDVGGSGTAGTVGTGGPAGQNGGGPGGGSGTGTGGGGGGGFSAVRRGTTRLVVAGGGGGAAIVSGAFGGAGGAAGASGSGTSGTGGVGATPFGAGAGGASGGAAGGGSIGGGGGFGGGSAGGGGGGGGGFFGGGGGGSGAGGGGGGSSFGSAGAILEPGVNNGAGRVVITFPVTGPSGGALTPLSPVRLCATPASTAPPQSIQNGCANGAIMPNETRLVTLAGTLPSPVLPANQDSPIPLAASAASFVLSVVSSQAGALTIFPADVATAPLAATMIFPANQFTSDGTVVKLGEGGGNAGKIKILNRGTAPVEIFLDANGYYG
jgi:hypothetical protein